MMIRDLKACPFCTSQPRDCYGYDYHKVRCSNDNCIISGVAMEKDVWNNQQRITDLEDRLKECERLHRELATSLRHDAESPSLCDLVAVVRLVTRERDELVATVERLREACQLAFQTPLDEYYSKNVNSILYQAINSTPSQNLNAVKREAFIEGFIKGYESDVSVDPKELAIDSVDLCYPDKEQSDE